MAWVSVDKNKKEGVFEEKPVRFGDIWCATGESYYVDLPEGTINKITGKPLNWYDEPVELK